MGYYMSQGDTVFKIRKERFNEAGAAIAALNGGSWVPEGHPHDLVSALEAWRWSAEVHSDNGDLIGLRFEGEKLGDEDRLFNALAPFVEEGSYLCMTGEDGTHWRWRFHLGQLREDTGTIHYE